MKNLRIYGTPPFNFAVIHGGPGAQGEMAPVARELSFLGGVLEPIQTAVTLKGQVTELRDVLEEHGTLYWKNAGISRGPRKKLRRDFTRSSSKKSTNAESGNTPMLMIFLGTIFMVQHIQEETKVLRDIRAHLDPIPELRNALYNKGKSKN